MPIVVVPGSGEPVEPGTPAPVFNDAYAISLFESDGTEWPLMRPELGWHLLDGITGIMSAVPVTISADDDAAGGTVIRTDGIHDLASIMTLPLRISGPDAASHRTRYRRLARAFTNSKRFGPARLVITHPDGVRRQVKVVYYGGFDAAPGDLSGWLYSNVVVQVYCPDAYWSAVDPQTFTSGQFAGDSVDFQDPYFGLSSSEILGDAAVIDNPGDAAAFPSYAINGPAALVTATVSYDLIVDVDLVTGLPVVRTVTRTWTIDPDAAGIGHGSLILGETVTITTRPPTVRGPDGSVWTAALGYPDNADLWSLPPGRSTVTIAMTGAANGSSVVGTYLPRFETP